MRLIRYAGVGLLGVGACIALDGGVRGQGSDVTVTVDRNTNATSSPAFRFEHVPPPAKDDLASHAVVKIVDGDTDPNGGAVNAVVDGLLPKEDDEPGANFFFDAGTSGGTFRMDLGSAVDIAAIHSYSWHPNTRGPQVYTLYASDGTDPKFNVSPRNLDPAAVGWTLLTHVDTRPKGDDPGGQYAVRIARAGGSLGKYRYLLFVCSVTETDDDWGNTFYSEIDVVGRTL